MAISLIPEVGLAIANKQEAPSKQELEGKDHPLQNTDKMIEPTESEEREREFNKSRRCSYTFPEGPLHEKWGA